MKSNSQIREEKKREKRVYHSGVVDVSLAPSHSASLPLSLRFFS